MLDKIKRKFSALWAEHVCDTFPYGYDKECVKCNKESCVDCPVVYRNKFIGVEDKKCGI